MPTEFHAGVGVRRRFLYRTYFLFGALTVILLNGCATTTSSGAIDVDPYEGFNRSIYTFNSVFDKHVASPVARGYKAVTPDPLEAGISNFFQNLSNINVVLNDLLQGKFKQGFEDTGRFAINSTIGIAGLFDVAKNFGLDQHDEDFGQTLAVWGVGQGPYLVLPLLGPTTVREAPGFAVEALTNPLLSAYPPLLGLGFVDTRARAESAIKFVNESALDPYVFTRESFLQWRTFLIYDGNPPMNELEQDFEDEIFEEDFDEPAAKDIADDEPNEFDKLDGTMDEDTEKAESRMPESKSDGAFDRRLFGSK